MEPRKRTHLVHELMQEAHLMMGTLEKAMECERSEERHKPRHDRLCWLTLRDCLSFKVFFLQYTT